MTIEQAVMTEIDERLIQFPVPYPTFVVAPPAST